MGPRRDRVYSFAASEAEVEAAGYSPPVPKPMMPREMVSIHTGRGEGWLVGGHGGGV